MWKPFREALQEAGYIDGQTISYNYRRADGDPQRLAFDLHQAAMRRARVSQDRGRADEAERSHHGHLDRTVGARARIERGDAALDEVNVLDAMEVVLQDGPALERDRGKMRRQPPKAGGVQAGENPIPDDHDTVRPRTSSAQSVPRPMEGNKRMRAGATRRIHAGGIADKHPR